MSRIGARAPRPRYRTMRFLSFASLPESGPITCTSAAGKPASRKRAASDSASLVVLPIEYSVLVSTICFSRSLPSDWYGVSDACWATAAVGSARSAAEISAGSARRGSRFDMRAKLREGACRAPAHCSSGGTESYRSPSTRRRADLGLASSVCGNADRDIPRLTVHVKVPRHHERPRVQRPQHRVAPLHRRPVRPLVIEHEQLWPRRLRDFREVFYRGMKTSKIRRCLRCGHRPAFVQQQVASLALA